MAADGINRIEPEAPDLRPILADYFWRTNEKTGYREHVRRSDGLVVHRERLEPKPQEATMRGKNRERAEALVGQRFAGIWEITALAGQHPRNTANMVMARCLRCSAEAGPYMAYEITSGRKKGHSGCTARQAGDGDFRADGAAPKRRKGGRRKKTSTKLVRVAPAARAIAVKPPPSNRRDLRSVATVVESLVGIAEQVTVEDAEALVSELEKIADVNLDLMPRGIPQIGGYLEAATAFLEFRRRLGD